ncbi:hypothetical protein BSL82_08170 [Tardibacter chloracetimidivorans]|uniref:Cell division protein FtsQ n=1 Tax=Tardibacter chloracetimidivorans TaxID=1921510 RepID=A0A1L3ZUP4_9SPHN|nr:cell division protein FtsQ/DivIB [Tardibacter chloracetimidivorans]API59289.1 hypothetical protein BSL82_08170 [Tardibacter chloracetimidivorans]
MSEPIALRRGSRPKPASLKRRTPPQTRRNGATSPFPPDLVRRATQWGIGGLIAVGSVVTVWLMGLPQQIAWETGEAIGRAGFAVRHVDVSGVQRMARLPVYAAALDQPSNAMPLVDLQQIRERLLAQPWVADVSVSRRLPDTLAIRVVEREPMALWQNQGVVHLVDANGVALQPVDARNWPDLPLIVGPDANLQAKALLTLLDAAPALKAEMTDAVWIGGRRWDIRFRSGETLALPEGDAAAIRALKLFAKLDGAQGLLKRGFVRFDMRLPDKMVIRVTDEPGRQATPVISAENAVPI